MRGPKSLDVNLTPEEEKILTKWIKRRIIRYRLKDYLLLPKK